MIQTRTTRDGIAFMSSAAALRVPAFTVIHRMQQVKPEHQVLGTAVALVAIAETLNLDLSDLMARAKRVLKDADGPFGTHIQAIRDYAAGEIRRT